MGALVALWWLSFFTALGLCVGSFLNAVIYRLPRNRSLCNPLWSFCPHCRSRIDWYDNLPVLSFVMLRGRCRHCSMPIATHYVIVEITMALVVLMLLDAFFIGQARTGLNDSAFGLTDKLSTDWPILIAHLILFACLLPMSAIDLEHYWVDVRFTNFATVAGFVLHTLWTPKHSSTWIRPSDMTSVICVLALVGLAITRLLMIVRLPSAGEEREGEAGEDAQPPLPEPKQPPVRQPPPPMTAPSRAGGWIAAVLLVAIFLVLWVDESGIAQLRHTGRALLPLVFLFCLVAREGMVVRPADRLIVEAIHEERSNARRMVLSELGLLLPALAGGLIGWWLMSGSPAVSESLSHAVHAKVPGVGMTMMRNWSPLFGFATAASGYVLGGALGWGVRVLFTLLFGKEALGMGDIHLMAAAGCVAGWPVVVLGFFLTCGLALVGWIIALPFKRSRALPLGPWLSLSFLAVTLFYNTIIRWPVIARVPDTLNLLMTNNPQLPLPEGVR